MLLRSLNICRKLAATLCCKAKSACGKRCAQGAIVARLVSVALVFSVAGCAQLKLPFRSAPADNVVKAREADGSKIPATPGATAPTTTTNASAPDTALPDVVPGDTGSERTGALDGLRRAAIKPSGAMDLGAAWRLTLLNDPAYQAALSQRAAEQTERALGRAALLPQIQASYYRGRVKGDRQRPDAFGVRQTSDLRYDSTSASLQLQQPVINYARWAEFRRGAAQAEQGEARFEVQRNRTAVRLAGLYFQALLAQGYLDLQNALVTSLEGHVQALQARFQQDQGTSTDVQETRARLALARAETFRAQDELRSALRELTLMLGRAPDALAPLQSDFKLQALTPSTLPQWLEHARQRSPEIALARKTLALAGTHVSAATARFLPYADLVASLNHANSDELENLSQKSNTYVVGLQVTIPIFTGGYNTAERSRASARRRVAESDYEATVEKVMADVIQQFTRVDGGEDRVNALQDAEESALLALEAASQSFDYGIASNLEVLKAQDALHQTRQELLTARLEYLMARVNLAAAADSVQDLTFDALSGQFLDDAAVPSQH